MEKTVSRTIFDRRSVRGFTGEIVPENIFHDIINSGRMAPSGSNVQPTYLIDVRDKVLREKICDQTGLRGKSEPHPQKFILKACHLVGVVSQVYPETRTEKWDVFYPSKDFEQRYLVAAIRDGAIVADHMVLQAAAYNVSTCFMSWFEQEPVKKILKVPHDHYIVTFIAFGYTRSEAIKKPERKPMDQFLYQDFYSCLPERSCQSKGV